MVTEITSNSYENGKRVEIQRVTFEKSDDLYTLANLQRRYESTCKQLENPLDESVREHLEAERDKLAAEIEKKETDVTGYDTALAEI